MTLNLSFFFGCPLICLNFFVSLPPFFKKDMQAELARRHHHQQQQPPSNTDPNHYMNVSFSVPQSTAASNYHLVSDPNGTNNNGNAMAAESIYGSDSTSSSAASSFVHLPLAVDNISARSLLGYDNVRFFFFWDRCAYCSFWDHPLSIL